MNISDRYSNIVSNTNIRDMSGTVYTRSGSLQSRLRNIWTCGMTLASAYMLCHIFAIWLQLQIEERSLREK